MRRVIYQGTIYSEGAVLRNAAVSAAANRWQSGLLMELARVADVTLLGHQQERMFPYGRLFPQSKQSFGFSRGLNVRYMNFPGWRTRSLCRAYAAEVARLACAPQGCSDLIAYNLTPWSIEAARAIRAIGRVTTSCIHADFDLADIGWNAFERLSSVFDRHIFLSHWAYKRSRAQRKYHLDGGFFQLPVFSERRNEKRRKMVYAGMIGEAKGVRKLLKIFDQLRGDGWSLSVYGKIDSRDGGAELVRDMDGREGIEYRGLVSSDTLEAGLRSAGILVNPVNNMMLGNDFNFPSKLYHYLEIGCPVVSEMLPALHPDYAEVLYTPRDNSISEWIRVLRAADGESDASREARLERTAAFIRKRLWRSRASELINWLSSDETVHRVTVSNPYDA